MAHRRSYLSVKAHLFLQVACRKRVDLSLSRSADFKVRSSLQHTQSQNLNSPSVPTPGQRVSTSHPTSASMSRLTPPINVRPQTGCPYIRRMQILDKRTPDVVTQGDLRPLRGVHDSIYQFLHNKSPKVPDGKSLDLPKISRQRGGFIEHPGSLGCSPELKAADGGLIAPRKDPNRLPLLLDLLGLENDELTHADLRRLSRLALDLDTQFFLAKYGRGLDADFSVVSFFAVGEVELAFAHLADDKGLVSKADLITLVNHDQLLESAERAAGKTSLPGITVRIASGLAFRTAMPLADPKYKNAAKALKDRAARGCLFDIDTGLVRA